MSNTDELNLDGWGPVADLLAWSLQGFWHMFLFLFALSIICGELARVYEYIFMDIPYIRPRFSGYLIGDIALSVAGGLAVESVHRFDGGDGLYNSKVTYLVVLVISCLAAIGLELASVRQNSTNPLVGFTWQQELLPSKLVHTLAFGPILAILICLGFYVVMNPRVIQVVAIVALVVCWAVLDQIVDSRRVDPNPDRASLPEERTNKVYLFVKAHPHRSRDRQMEGWREEQRVRLAATV